MAGDPPPPMKVCWTETTNQPTPHLHGYLWEGVQNFITRHDMDTKSFLKMM